MPELNIGECIRRGGIARRFRARPSDRMRQIAEEAKQHTAHFDMFRKTLKDSCEKYAEHTPEARRAYHTLLAKNMILEDAMDHRRSAEADVLNGIGFPGE